jgi:ribonuclease HI
VKGWKKKGWKTSTGKAVLNQDLWETLDRLNCNQVKWEYVRGHAGNEGNERCDAIARAFSLGKTPTLEQTTLSDLFATEVTEAPTNKTLQSSGVLSEHPDSTSAMTDSNSQSSAEIIEQVPGETRVAQLRNLVETLRIADDIANQRYLITSGELAALMDVHTSAVTSRGDNWVWRNWVVSRVRREGNQILWQLERVD